jgi:hypothetical protein
MLGLIGWLWMLPNLAELPWEAEETPTGLQGTTA